MNNTEKIIVFNTLTNELQEVYVTPEVAQTFKRTGWNIKDNDKSFFKHEIQMSALVGGQENAYENFREFVSDTNNMQEAIEKQFLIEKLHKALESLNKTDYKIIYLLFHDCLSERECAEKIGVSQICILQSLVHMGYISERDYKIIAEIVAEDYEATLLLN